MKKLFLLPLDLQTFAEENPPTEPVENPTVEEPVTKTEEPPAEKTLTQSEFEEALRKRLERERKKYEGFDELKTKASEYEKLVEEKRLTELSEKERLEEIAKKHEAEKQELAKQLEQMQSAIKSEKIRNSFITKAQAAGIAYVDDAFQLSSNLLSAVSVDEEGIHGIDEIITELITNKPFLLAQNKKPQKQIGEPSNGNLSDEIKTLEAQLEDAKKAKNFTKVIELSNLIASKK